tara:strand:+ start:443 stop:835 length:393 start_codon:yes stop_codon:yes gene_type:complete
MKRLLPLLTALLLACGSPSHDTANPAADFPGNLLQPNKFYTDYCFILLCTSEACTDTTVYAIEENTGYLEDREWPWTYEPPSLYIINGHDIYVYPSEEEGYWELEGDVSLFGETPWSVTLEAAPCTLELY